MAVGKTKKSSSEISDPRSRILEAAFQAFVAKGLEGARTREIAQAAGVNVAMVHYYFGSKYELYLKVVQPIFAQISEKLKISSLGSRNLPDLIETVVDTYFDFLKEHPSFPKLMMWEIVTGGKNLDAILRPTLFSEDGWTPEMMLKAFKDSLDSGTGEQHSPKQALISLIGLCVFPFIASTIISTVFPDSSLDSSFIEERRGHVKVLLIRGLSLNNR